jgi:hypothetical protein
VQQVAGELATSKIRKPDIVIRAPNSASPTDRLLQHLLKPGIFLVDGRVGTEQWTIHGVTACIG